MQDMEGYGVKGTHISDIFSSLDDIPLYRKIHCFFDFV